MKLQFIFLFALATLLTSCESRYWSVQRSEAFISSHDQTMSIISFRPEIEFKSAKKNLSFEQMERQTLKLERIIKKAAKRNHLKIDQSTAQGSSSVAYYEQLLYLRKNITDVCFRNYSSLYANGRMQENQLVKSVYVYPPRLPFEVNSFSKIFGSKYFSCMKVTVYENTFNLQHVVIDTDLAETVYNEKKTLNSKFKPDLLAQMIFDSYALLKQELSAK